MSAFLAPMRAAEQLREADEYMRTPYEWGGVEDDTGRIPLLQDAVRALIQHCRAQEERIGALESRVRGRA